MLREIVVIDEEKCDGCGLCVPACHEGAIRIVNGKARLAGDNLCDGLGACLGHCPQDAIRIERREAVEFDEQAVRDHLGLSGDPRPYSEDTETHRHGDARTRARTEPGSVNPASQSREPHDNAALRGAGILPAASDSTNRIDAGTPATAGEPRCGDAEKRVSGDMSMRGQWDPGGASLGGGCPSSRFLRLGPTSTAPAGESAPVPAESPCGDALCSGGGADSELRQWPIQLRLLPGRAPMLKGASLLVAADCVPFAYAGFHRQMLRGRAVAIACPKLDDPSGYVEKLAEMIRDGGVKDITVSHMEVPCCTGILRMAIEARRRSGRDIPLQDIVVSTHGDVLQQRRIPAADMG